MARLRIRMGLACLMVTIVGRSDPVSAVAGPVSVPPSQYWYVNPSRHGFDPEEEKRKR
jgi:hypothetical protein